MVTASDASMDCHGENLIFSDSHHGTCHSGSVFAKSQQHDDTSFKNFFKKRTPCEKDCIRQKKQCKAECKKASLESVSVGLLFNADPRRKGAIFL